MSKPYESPQDAAPDADNVFVGGSDRDCPTCGESRNDAREVHVCHAQRDFIGREMAKIKAKQAARVAPDGGVTPDVAASVGVSTPDEREPVIRTAPQLTTDAS